MKTEYNFPYFGKVFRDWDIPVAPNLFQAKGKNVPTFYAPETGWLDICDSFAGGIIWIASMEGGVLGLEVGPLQVLFTHLNMLTLSAPFLWILFLLELKNSINCNPGFVHLLSTHELIDQIWPLPPPQYAFFNIMT